MSVTFQNESIRDVTALEEILSRPRDFVIDALAKTPGDIVILGVAGKMGPTLARMAQRGSIASGSKRRIIGIARFTNPAERESLESHGIETIRADLMQDDQLNALPDAPNVIYMAGMKFGATGNEGLTWAMNCFLPGMVCKRYRTSRIVAFSTGNIYGLSPIDRGGSRESDPLNPVGDYAMSCVGRERIFDHFSRALSIPVSIIRLYYATELRYGVLVDIATKVHRGETIDLSMGYLNAIWQQDANAQSLAALARASSPPFVLNVVGPERLSMRAVAMQFGEMMDEPSRLAGVESPDALLGNSDLAQSLFGCPGVGVQQMMRWIASWVQAGGASINRPTHFQEREGKF